MKRRYGIYEGGTYLFWLRDEGRNVMATLYWDDGILRLQPINRRLPPIFKQPSDVDIRGRVLKTISVKSSMSNWPTG